MKLTKKITAVRKVWNEYSSLRKLAKTTTPLTSTRHVGDKTVVEIRKNHEANVKSIKQFVTRSRSLDGHSYDLNWTATDLLRVTSRPVTLRHLRHQLVYCWQQGEYTPFLFLDRWYPHEPKRETEIVDTSIPFWLKTIKVLMLADLEKRGIMLWNSLEEEWVDTLFSHIDEIGFEKVLSIHFDQRMYERPISRSSNLQESQTIKMIAASYFTQWDVVIKFIIRNANSTEIIPLLGSITLSSAYFNELAKNTKLTSKTIVDVLLVNANHMSGKTLVDEFITNNRDELILRGLLDAINIFNEGRRFRSHIPNLEKLLEYTRQQLVAKHELDNDLPAEWLMEVI